MPGLAWMPERALIFESRTTVRASVPLTWIPRPLFGMVMSTPEIFAPLDTSMPIAGVVRSASR